MTEQNTEYRPQPRPRLSDSTPIFDALVADAIHRDCDRIASHQVERDTPRRTFPRLLAVFLVVAAVLVVVAVAWLVTT